MHNKGDWEGVSGFIIDVLQKGERVIFVVLNIWVDVTVGSFQYYKSLYRHYIS